MILRAGLAALVAAVSLVAQPRQLALQPLGKLDVRLAPLVRLHLEATFDCPVTCLPPRALPREAFYPPRQRYRGTQILDALLKDPPPGVRTVLALTPVDVSVTKGEIPDWGVYGVAYLMNRAAVVSTFRLRKGGANQALFERRLKTVCTHEVGHTLGLPHCPRTGCVMEDVKGTMTTVDRSTGRFCPTCTKSLGPWLKPGVGWNGR